MKGTDWLSDPERRPSDSEGVRMLNGNGNFGRTPKAETLGHWATVRLPNSKDANLLALCALCRGTIVALQETILRCHSCLALEVQRNGSFVRSVKLDSVTKMNDPLLETWEYRATTTSTTVVVPDGCRDLIGRSSRCQPPTWFVTSVDVGVRKVSIQAGDSLMGFRLKPGTSIDTCQLLGNVDAFAHGIDVIAARIRETCSLF